MNELLQFLSHDLFTKVVGSAAILSAGASLLATFVGLVNHTLVARHKLRLAEEEKFREALETDDLVKLGDYLSSSLGQFTVQEYSSEKPVAARVDRMFARLAEFIGSTETVQKSVDEGVNIPSVREYVPFSTAFAHVKTDIESGEVWNGLARLRRIIELRLRKLGASRGFKERHLRSAGQALRILADREYVPEGAVSLLQYAIRICNQGVHGDPVSTEESLAALSAAIKGLELLERGESPPADPDA